MRWEKIFMKCDLLKPFYIFRCDPEDVEGFNGGHSFVYRKGGKYHER
jgi:hypothetical protein